MDPVTSFTKARSRHGSGVLQLIYRCPNSDRHGGIASAMKSEVLLMLVTERMSVMPQLQ